MSDFIVWNKENIILAACAGLLFAVTYEPAAYFIRRWLKKRWG